MNIIIHPEVESQLRVRAEAQGLKVDTYVDRLVRSDLLLEDYLDALAVAGINSGDPIEPGSEFWREKHHRLDEKLENGVA